MSVAEANVGFEAVLLRLQREHKTVARLLIKMKSYRMEPKSYDCFLLMQELKNDLTALYWDQKLTMDNTSATTVENQLTQKAKSFSIRFSRIEQKVAEYLLKVA